ncbi:hypothetical protein K437DRAFT_253632 [Tilletiaria anomala UBC 951]|uniref:NADH dehydrogenase [ubiquinone] 1 beta subcomplex subunit 11, mitochondrial n=1 Tax=Tilletiaria anomala (strain ATCC 24038 / CBS 436.72 / UBC 951) TaxID=1037660 RepID=A0A066WGQ5_TILAU|nr:uncharacterized protein K437DRAFT_253632 [Tilletiaria anomala UBC 951]KDN52981.1 hypothetical protein K437DRAFT_253632 [Tilletiaria anomala UBC 951]
MSLKAASSGTVAAARQALRAPSTVARTFVQRRFASGGGGYNPPTGRLFNEKPLPPGQKREKEGWESLWTYGMWGSIVFGTVLYMYKPDTSIQSWALPEATKRLEQSGKAWQYKPSVNSGYPESE